MRELGIVRKQLRKFGIRDACDYAEVLIAEALNGKRLTNRAAKGHDVVTPTHGRIEVKCRQLSVDGRIEERVAVGSVKQGGFDFLAVVVFEPDFAVKGAVIVPYAATWKLVTRQAYNRISYVQACELDGAIDITKQVQKVAER